MARIVQYVVALWEAFYIENKRFGLDTSRNPGFGLAYHLRRCFANAGVPRSALAAAVVRGRRVQGGRPAHAGPTKIAWAICTRLPLLERVQCSFELVGTPYVAFLL